MNEDFKIYVLALHLIVSHALELKGSAIVSMPYGSRRRPKGIHDIRCFDVALANNQDFADLGMKFVEKDELEEKGRQRKATPCDWNLPELLLIAIQCK